LLLFYITGQWVLIPEPKLVLAQFVDKIPQEYSSTKIVQSSNFLAVVMDEILRASARSARTRFFQILPRSSRCLVDEIPRAAAKSVR
jgi:hypothetical protein